MITVFMKYSYWLCITALFIIPFTTLAYEPLVNIPGLDAPTGREADIGNLVNALFGIAIAIAAMLAVIKLIIGGVKYMLSDIVTTKGEARNEITSALLGLLLILATTLILSTINSQITGFSILDGKLDVRWKSATPDEPVEGLSWIDCITREDCAERCAKIGKEAGSLTEDRVKDRVGTYCTPAGENVKEVPLPNEDDEITDFTTTELDALCSDGWSYNASLKKCTQSGESGNIKDVPLPTEDDEITDFTTTELDALCGDGWSYRDGKCVRDGSGATVNTDTSDTTDTGSEDTSDIGDASDTANANDTNENNSLAGVEYRVSCGNSECPPETECPGTGDQLIRSDVMIVGSNGPEYFYLCRR